MKTRPHIHQKTKYINIPSILTLSLIILSFTSCKKDNNDNTGKSIVKEINIDMSTAQEIPTVKDRTETGKANLKLYVDSTLGFNISVNNLDPSDQLTLSHVHVGGPVDAGVPVIVLVDNVTIKFNGSAASGTIKVTGDQYNNLVGTGGFYVNVHSAKFPAGLIRGQMGMSFAFAMNVDLTPIANSLRPEMGTAILRLTSDSTLVYKVTVENLTSGDQLSSADIQVGASGISGPSVIPLYSGPNEFGVAKTLKLSSSQVNFLLNSPVYVNVHSNQLPEELIRGQIR
jgi:hypothetical protein